MAFAAESAQTRCRLLRDQTVATCKRHQADTNDATPAHLAPCSPRMAAKYSNALKGATPLLKSPVFISPAPSSLQRLTPSMRSIRRGSGVSRCWNKGSALQPPPLLELPALRLLFLLGKENFPLQPPPRDISESSGSCTMPCGTSRYKLYEGGSHEHAQRTGCIFSLLGE